MATADALAVGLAELVVAAAVAGRGPCAVKLLAILPGRRSPL